MMGLSLSLSGRRGFALKDIGGCEIWLRPDAGRVTLVSGDHVSAVANAGTESITVSQSTDANRPQHIPSDVNGRPGIRGGATKWLAVAGDSAPSSMTLFVVLTHSSLALTYHLSTSNDNMGIIEGFGNGLEWFNGADRYVLAASVGAGAHIVTVSQVDAGALIGYYDGAQVFSHTATVTNKVIANLGNSQSHTNGSDGDWLEIVRYNSILSDANRGRVLRALASRYGVTLS